MAAVKTLVQQAQELEEKYIEMAWREFSKMMGELALDERDGYPSFEEITKGQLGYIPAGSELYTQYSHDAAEWLQAAGDLARLYRLGDRVSIAKAEDKFHQYA
jgi:hypothetical protein